MNSTEFHFPNGLSAKEDAASRDAQLVTAARAGSSDAFQELQRLYALRLSRKIFSITKNREDTEDALQDTFLHAYMKLDTFEGRSGVYTWLTRIAINSALMIIRKRRVRSEVFFEQSSESGEDTQSFDIRDTAMNPEEFCDQHQRCRGVQRAIQRLNPSLRTAIGIWIAQGCSMKEIAQALNVPIATVKARLHRARLRLSRSPALRGYAAKMMVSGSASPSAILGFQSGEQPCMNGD